MSESLRSVAQQRATLRAQEGDFGVPGTDTPIDKFRLWLAEKDEANHSYSRKAENKKFARGKDVDRYFSKEYDTFSTVMLTYCAGVPDSAKEIVPHSERFYPRALRRKRRRLLKKLGVWDECAGVAVLAPKEGDRVPTPNSPTAFSHAHTFLWVPGEVSEEDFRPLIDTHIQKVEGATAEAHREGAVRVEVHDSAEVRTPLTVQSRGAGTDSERGATTALPQELGNNLPLLKCRYDARGAPSYAEEWCAHLRLGRDGELATRGVSRFRPFGRFNEIADRMHLSRKVRTAVENAEALSEVAGVPPSDPPTATHPSPNDNSCSKNSETASNTLSEVKNTTQGSTESVGEGEAGAGRVPSPNSPTLSDEEQQFVNQYLAEVSDTSEQRIERELERNIRRGKLPPDTDIQGVVTAIQQK